MSTKKLQIVGQLGNTIYIQDDEPTDAPDGSLWVDLDEDGVSSSETDLITTANEEITD